MKSYRVGTLSFICACLTQINFMVAKLRKNIEKTPSFASIHTKEGVFKGVYHSLAE